ncbi:MAG: hypothetical protein AAF614_08995 [Chloroflexota bacterium]
MADAFILLFIHCRSNGKRHHRLVWCLYLGIIGLLLGCVGGQETAVSNEPFILPTPTPQPTTELIVASILTDGTLTPTPTPNITTTPQPTKALPTPTATPDITSTLRFGTAPELASCAALTAAVADMLQDTVGIQVAVIPFKTNDALFESLASTQAGSADITLCYRDSKDREILQHYFGFVEVLGDHYWSDGEERLQVLLKTAVLLPLQTNHPCTHRYLQSLNLGNQPLSAQAPPALPTPMLDC